jgi:hypothetical protein
VLLSRRKHLKPWLEAIEALGIVMPAQINRAASSARGRQPSADHPKRLPAAPGNTPNTPSTPGKRFSKGWVEDLAGCYSYQSDEAVVLAGKRAAAAGHYSRADFLTVVRWKSARAIPHAERNSSQAVKKATKAAFGTDDELVRLGWMISLSGVGVPVASALLHFAFPDRYPILDYRALSALGDPKRRSQYTATFWTEYVSRCRDLAKRAGVSIRELDKALWQYSRETDP